MQPDDQSLLIDMLVAAELAQSQSQRLRLDDILADDFLQGVHGYDQVDFDLVWATIREDLPPLIDAIKQIVQGEP